MNWADVIAPARIGCGVTLEGKREAIALLCEIMGRDLGVESAQLQKAMIAREMLGATAIGNGVLLPHAMSDVVTRPVAGVLTLDRPLGCTTPDGVPIDLIVGLLMPPDAKGVSLLAKLMAPLRQESTLQALRLARTPQEASAILHQA